MDDPERAPRRTPPHTSTPQGSGHPRSRRLVVAAAAFFGSLLAAEVVLRIALPELSWQNTEDVSLGWVSGEYREFDPAARPRSGRQRILFLGDSMLAGGGVSSLEDRFPDVLERSVEGIEVAVLASGGWGPDQQFLAYLQKGVAWQPDLVVAAFTANNDLANVVSNARVHGVLKPYFVLGEEGRLSLRDPYGAPLDVTPSYYQSERPFQSRLVGLVRYVASQGREPTTPRIESAVDPRYLQYADYKVNRTELLAEVRAREPRLSWSPQSLVSQLSAFVAGEHELTDYQWSLLGEIYAGLAREVARNGSELVVLLLPVPINGHDAQLPQHLLGSSLEREFDTPDGPVRLRLAEPRERLASVLAQHGIELIDPVSEFTERVVEGDLMKACWPRRFDPHFSEVGHRILAELLASELRDRGHL